MHEAIPEFVAPPWPSVGLRATSVYWANGYSGWALWKVGLDGGPPAKLASAENIIYGIAVDATSVYWTEHGPDGAVRKLTPK